MPRAIGIDLGTTNTAVAVLDGGRPRVIEDERGYKVLPSVVSAKGEGRFIVGQAAHSLIITNPDATVYATKRLMGRRFDSPEVQKVLTHVQYKLRAAPDGGVQLQIGDQWMTPSEVAAVILQVARGIAERALGEPVEEAVITVPAYFNHAQRKATLAAAEIAGLRCDRLLNEPTAAALAYGHRKNIERTIVIFDLGGGTFDVSVLKLADGIYEILASTGDTFLGGEDFDYRVVDHLADHFKARARVDPRQDRGALQRLKDAAERAKCELSFSDRTNIVIPHLAAGESLEMVLTRTTLESLTADLVDRCVDIARRAVSDAGLSLTDVEEVILVGGQTRMPKVREAVIGVFGREPNRSVHPEEVVAIGAAVHAANLEAGASAPTVLLDVTPFDLGIDTAGGMFVPVIPRNARIPASQSKVFATVADKQETVRITVRQGDDRASVQNEFLGEFVLEGLTPAPRLQTKVDVTFRIDTNGILHVAAVERGKDERRNIVIRNYAEHARAPAFPDPEQARADELARKMRPEKAEAGPAKTKPGGRGSLIDMLLGRKKPGRKPAEVATTAAAVVAAGAAAAAAADAAGETLAPDAEPHLTFGEAPISTIGDTEDGLPEAEVASLLEEWNEADLTPADGLVLDPFLEPRPVPLDDLEGLGRGVGLSPFEEEVYEDIGMAPSLGLAGGLAGAQAQDNPFADLENPAAAPTRSRALSLSDLFLEEDGLGDVEVADPFAAGRPSPQANRAPPPALPDAFAGLFEGTQAAGADPLAEPFPAARPAPPTRAAFLHDLSNEWDEAGGLASDVTLFATGDDEDAEPELPREGGGVSSNVDVMDDAMFASIHEETASAHEDPDFLAGPDLLGPRGGGWPDSGVSVTPTDEPAGRPVREEPAATGFALVDPDTDVRAALRGAATPESPRTEPAQVTDWTDRSLTAEPAWSITDARSEAHTIPDFEAGQIAPPPSGTRRPARVRLHYRELDTLVAEARENLRRGGTFIRTERPLKVGRACVFEVSAPGLPEPIVLPALVTFVATAGPGQEAGMGVDYTLEDGARQQIERLLNRL